METGNSPGAARVRPVSFTRSPERPPSAPRPGQSLTQPQSGRSESKQPEQACPGYGDNMQAAGIDERHIPKTIKTGNEGLQVRVKIQAQKAEHKLIARPEAVRRGKFRLNIKRQHASRETVEIPKNKRAGE